MRRPHGISNDLPREIRTATVESRFGGGEDGGGGGARPEAPRSLSAKYEETPPSANGEERRRSQQPETVTDKPQAPMKRSHSWDTLTTAPQIDRTPVRLYLNAGHNCLALLHVRCQDQVGFLFTLSDMVMRHGIDVDRADIATVGKDVDNRMVLRAARPSDFADAKEWCDELKSVVMTMSRSSGRMSDTGDQAQLNAAASRLAVNPHLLCVARFQKLGVQGVDNSVLRSPEGHKQTRMVHRYRLEVKGINQAGLLAYLSLVLSHSGFNIVRAHIDTADGYVSDMFDLKTESTTAERRLRSFLHIPANTEMNLSLPELQMLWAGGASPVKPGLLSSLAPLNSPDKISPPSPQFIVDDGKGKRFELSNGDVYEGDMDESNMRQGHGMYTYAGGQATYLRYSGQWLDNKKHGFGTLIFRDGSAYVGQWRASKRHGIGVYFGYGDNGASGPGAMPSYRYEGEWAADLQSGIGVEETDEHLYCGHFSNGAPCGAGMKILLRVTGLTGCSVLQGETWTPLVDAMRAEMARVEGAREGDVPSRYSSSRRLSKCDESLGLSSAKQALAASQAAAAHTIHAGCTTDSVTQKGLADLMFDVKMDDAGDDKVKKEHVHRSHSDDEQMPVPLPTKEVDKSAKAGAQGLLQRLSTPGVEARRLAATLMTPARRKAEESKRIMVAPDVNPVSAGPTPSPPNMRMNQLRNPEKKETWDSETQGPLDLKIEQLPSQRLHRPGLSQQSVGLTPRVSRIPNGVAALASPPKSRVGHTTAWQSDLEPAAEGTTRRALTPESKTMESRDRPVIACPMLWGIDEVACIISCIGVGEQVNERLRGIRLFGTQQLLEMSNVQMSQDLGLSAPLERLLVRRCLQHLTEADRYENSARGRSVCDVMNDTSLKPFIIPAHNLTLVQNLSQGGFGVVYKGSLKVSSGGSGGDGEPKQKWVAVKEMLGDQRVRLYECLKEAHVMASLRHKNICKFIGVCTDGKPRGKRYIVSELLDCSLFDFVHRSQRVSWPGTLDVSIAIWLAQGICTGLAYIHSRNLVHADLKSSNILIDLGLKAEDDYKPVPRICDFGHAAVRTAATPHDRLCTPHWAAPEVLRSEGLGPAADVFSVGVLLWEMLAKSVPHSDLGFGQVLAAVGWAGLIPDMAALPPALPDELRRILHTCLSFLPGERPSAKEVKRRLQRLPRMARLEAIKMLQSFVGCAT